MDADPRENRLTECFSAVLREIPELLDGVLALWRITPPAAVPVELRTQPMTPSGYFIDLQIRYGDALLVWVEIKHGARLGPQQLRRYSSDLQVLPARQRELVLLAPARLTADEDELETYASGATWQDTADLCRDALPQLEDPVKRWLLRQFVAYLEEEGLSQSRLTADHVEILANGIAAWRTLEDLIELVLERVDETWGPRVAPKRPSSMIDIDFKYAPFGAGRPKATAKTWRDSTFNWSFAVDDRSDDPNIFAFSAYAWLGKTRPELKEGNRAWLGSLANLGYEYEHDGRDAWLTRWLEPTRLIGKGTLSQQADYVADWIATAFRELPAPPT